MGYPSLCLPQSLRVPQGITRPRSRQFSKRVRGVGKPAFAKPSSTSCSLSITPPSADRLTTRRPNRVLLFWRARPSGQQFAIPRSFHNERRDETGTVRTAPTGSHPPLASGEERWPSAKETTNRNTRGASRAAHRGLSRSAARGHPRAGERRNRRGAHVDPNSREELALKMMRRGASLRDAAASLPHQPGAPARLRQGADRSTHERRQLDDHRPALAAVSVLLGRSGRHPVDEPRQDVRGRPLHAGGKAVSANAATTGFPAPFAGKGARDLNGKFHPFELDENTLYELDHRDEAVIPEQYRISERIAS